MSVYLDEWDEEPHFKNSTGLITIQYLRNLSKTWAVGAIVGYEHLSGIKDADK